MRCSPATAAAPTRRRATRGPALRPWSRENRRERRLSRRLAAGLTPAQAAGAEGLPESEVTALLADPAFAELVEAYREIRAEPEDAARETLRRLARILLEDAVAEGDVGAALFVLREEARGRDPAETLARGVIAAARRPVEPAAFAPAPATAAASTPAAAPSSPTLAPVPPPSRGRPPAHPADRAAWQTAARLRAAVLVEHATLRRVTTPAAAPASSVPASTSPNVRPSGPAPNRHERRRRAAARRRQPILTRCPDRLGRGPRPSDSS